MTDKQKLSNILPDIKVIQAELSILNLQVNVISKQEFLKILRNIEKKIESIQNVIKNNEQQ